MDSLQAELAESLAAALYMEESQIEHDLPFTELGLDSIIGVEWVNKINKRYGLKIPATKVYDYPTLTDFAGYVGIELKKKGTAPLPVVSPPVGIPLKKPSASITQPRPIPEKTSASEKAKTHGGIAIVGMSGRYPGAVNLTEFWDNLVHARNSIQEIPGERWDWRDHYDPDPAKPGKIYCKWLGSLSEIDCFDPGFFMISPAEAEGMDPQHRLFLEEAYRAFEEAGYSPQTLSDKKCGVYMGIMSSEYVHLLSQQQTTGLNTGNSFSIAAARVPYYLNLKGPAIPIDTACSSSLVATHLACQSLRNGETDMALVGGVTLYLTPASFIGMCAAGMLSADGQCKSFDDGANGFVPGEGVGTLVLKRLEDAQRDGDVIHGVIIGSGINHDGRTNGITAPSVTSQMELERDVYQRFNIDPGTIDYVETHGTGTKLGDPIELEALTAVFRELTPRRNFCGIGSVKSNIGHTSAAAGVAGIQKMLLSMKHGKLVPTLNFEKPNAHCDFEDSPFYVNTETKTWRSQATTPRRAAISSFGFSGTNAHVVIEEYVDQRQAVPSSLQDRPTLIVLSARNEERLMEMVRNLQRYLKSGQFDSTCNIHDLAHTLQVGREAMEERVAVAASSIEELIEKLGELLKSRSEVPDVWRGRVKRTRGKLALFEANEETSKWIDIRADHGKHTRLMELWVTGLIIDWNHFYGANKPRRISLPTYPFARERYWVSAAPVIEKSITKVSSLPPPPSLVMLSDPARAWNSASSATPTSRALKPLKLQLPVSGLASEAPSIKVEVMDHGDGIHAIRVSHQDGQSWLSEEMVFSLTRSFQKIRDREDAKVILLDGDENVFCSGEMKSEELLLEQKISRLIQDCEIPVIAMRNGQMGRLSDFMVDSAHAMQLAREITQSPREALIHLKRHLSRDLTVQKSATAEEAEPSWLELSANVAPDPGAPESVETGSDVVKFDVYQNGVVLMTLCDTQSKNTFSEALARGVEDCFEHIRRTPGYKVLVLTGFGNYFACGGTKQALLAIQEGVAKCTDSKITGLPLECEIPVIAAMQGHGIGAGWSMGMFCDEVFLSEESTYHSPYLRYGFTPGAGSTLIFPERLGKDLGREILFTAKEYKGHELKSRGMKLSVLPRTEVVSCALQLAHRLALCPRETLVRVKAARTHHLRSALEPTYALEVALHEKTFVGRQEVRARIEQQFSQGVAPGALATTGASADDVDSTASDAAMLNSITYTLRDTLAIELHTKPGNIDLETAFIEMGLDSINNVTWVRGLNQRYGLSIGATEVYNHPTIRAFAEHILKQGKLLGLFHPEKRTDGIPVVAAISPPVLELGPEKKIAPAEQLQRVARDESRKPQSVKLRDIAVIGMSGQFPQARNVAEFWDNLVRGRDCISPIPAGRWSIDEYYDPNPQAPGKTNCKWMGAVEDVDKFDPLFFSISPLEAASMDPQQRLFLESCWSCIEDAGYDPVKLSGSKCGVFVGCGPGDYGLSVDSSDMDASAMMGGAMSILAARISYLLNLQGPCVALDTACSSSLVAIASACDSLVLEASDVALAGGVSIMSGPTMHIMTSKAGMLSPDGRCFTFDQRANGFVPGEGVGVLLLKRLEDAERDGDRIDGVIRGWGVNQDGKTNGITAPSGDSQTRLEKDVYERYGLNPEGIQLIEAHGTGTKLGDPIEAEGLKASFRSFTRKENFCALGSVKSNVGHMLAASGVAGVIKTLLALKHRQLPPTIHFENLNEHIRLEGSPFYVNTECKEWRAPEGHARRAAVSSFGFSGTNAHMVIEEYQEQAARADETTGPVIIVLSAKNPERLKEAAQNLVRYLAAGSSACLKEIAYTLQVGRSAMNERLGLVVESVDELKRGLEAFVAGQEAPGLYLGRAKRSNDGSSTLAADEAMRGAIEKWIPAGEYAKLVELWVRGSDIDWNRLYPKSRPRRVGLPTYPFARERYWREQKNRPAASLKPSKPELPEGEFGLYYPVWGETAVDTKAAPPAYITQLVLLNGFEPAQVQELEARLSHAVVISLCSDKKDSAERFCEVALGVFERVKAILEQKPKGKVLIQVLISSRGDEPLASGVMGLLKTAREENPRIIGQVIETDSHDDLLSKLRENTFAPEEAHICYRNGNRMLPVWEEFSPSASAVSLPWKEQGIYLITGGVGGLGLIFAREIATKAKQPTLILVGRSTLNGKTQETLEVLRSLGAKAIYRQADVTDAAAVTNLMDGIRSEFGRLDGILHAAGINRGNFIIKKPTSEFTEVLASKVLGTENLDRAVGDRPLDFFVLFSSIAGVTGNVGQVDYATANAFLDAFATRRNARVEANLCHGRTLAINWPLWKEGGMGIEAATEALMKGHSGIVSLATADGILAFYRAMVSRQPQVAVTLRKAPGLGHERLDNKPERHVEHSANTVRLPEGKDLLERTRHRLKRLLGETINLSVDRIESDEPMESYGIDSILISQLNVKLDEVFPEVSKTLLFEVRTLGELAESLVGDFEQECLRWTQPEDEGNCPRTEEIKTVVMDRSESRVSTPLRSDDGPREPLNGTNVQVQEPIAVIGICGHYAQADTLDAFWEHLKSGTDCVTEIPPERWALEGFFHDDPEEAIKQGKSYSKWGSFLEGFAEFDPLFFNISPLEALGMDPQERLFLQSSWEVLESAGYTRARLAETIDGDVGVFAGVTKTGFDQYRAEWRKQGEIVTPFTSFGGIANRVSYVLNLKGPSMPIDTMCSSSLTAIHEACEQLRHGRCQMAIAGGVNLYVHPSSYVGLCAARMLSRDGKCKSFGAGGNGFVPGEGVGVILLKPLSKALADGDLIHAIIRGTSVNHGGKTNGYTVPNPNAQREVIHDALVRSGVDARKVSYIEAHGTGTELGDPIEVTGLTQAFAKDTSDTGFCALGSAKSNLGHLEAAAGIAGVTKVLLQMKHQKLVPSLHAGVLNPIINFSKTPFVVQQELADWIPPTLVHDDKTIECARIAGVSSFGAGGANAHVIIEEAPQMSDPSVRRDGPVLVVLSAKTEERLHAYAKKLGDFLSVDSDTGGLDLHDLAFTLQIGREAMVERVAFVAAGVPELREKLAAFVEKPSSVESCFRGRVQRNTESLSAFYGDEDMRHTIEAWLRKGKLARVAELWVRGGSLDWEKLYGENIPRRIVLPTYPFAKEEHWVKIVPAKAVEQSSLHPMVHANSSDLSGLRFSSIFTGEEFFLTDHVVNGAKVLPGVAYLEMARFAARQATGATSDRAIIRNLVWVRPISTGDFGNTVNLTLVETENDGLSFSIESGEVIGQPLVRSQGFVFAGTDAEAPVLDLPHLRTEIAGQRIDGRECYRAFTAMGLSYGSRYQGIQDVTVGAGQALARLTLPGSLNATAKDYVLHPSLLDSALQSCAGLWLAGRDVLSENAPTFVPYALDEAEVFGSCVNHMWAWIRPSHAELSATIAPKLDIDLCDENGRVCVALRGLSFRRFEVGADREGRSATLMMSPAWTAADVPMGASPVEYAGRSVIVCEVAALSSEGVEKIWPGASCINLQFEGEGLDQRFQEASSHVFGIIRELLGTRVTKGKQLVQVVIPSDPEGLLFGGLSGLLKTARLENPEFVGQVIAVDPHETEEGLLRKLKENSHLPEDVQIRYEDGGREVVSWHEEPGASDATTVPWKDGGVYLITGGAGGLGMIFAEAIAQQTKGATLILCGRSDMSGEKQERLSAIEKTGAKIAYRRVDVSRLRDAAQLIADVQREYGTINGILHSAGIIRDRLITNKSEGEFQDVLAPKVSGTVHLDQASHDIGLDFFVLFSAGAGVFGNPGQADYATANAFMDEFARYRNKLVAAKQRHGVTLSVDWPLWEEGGMTIDETAVDLMKQKLGMTPLSVDAGIDALFRALASGKDQVLVMSGERNRLRALFAKETMKRPEVVGRNHGEERSSDTDDSLEEKTIEYFRELLSSTLRVPLNRIHSDGVMSDLGIDSVVVMSLTNRLEESFGALSKTLFFEHQTIRALARYFIESHPGKLRLLFQPEKVTVNVEAPVSSPRALQARAWPKKMLPERTALNLVPPAEPRSVGALDIAIIGVSGRYPKAKNIDEFWEILRDGRDCITEVPADRWDWRDYYSEDLVQTRGHSSKWGGFIDGVDKFDPQFFNISPRIAPYLDPQERLILEEAWKALEDAGYRREELQKQAGEESWSPVGVYIGAMYGEYQLLGAEASLTGQRLGFAGNLASIANRLSYVLNLHGPSMMVDTMCSSSLTCIHLACQDLVAGRTNYALAGGVNVTIHPNKYLMLSGGQFLSAGGRCESFGEGGAGYIPSEGVGVVVLKRLADAERDGDHIYGVIKSTAVNHGGRTHGYSVPNPKAQERVIAQALEEAGIDPRAVSYIEAHGTGTKLGDPIEIAGLARAFGRQPGDVRCWLGSAKSNIGHCEAAAGIAGLTKVLLQMKHGQIAPSLHSQVLNPHIDFASTPFVVNQTLREWEQPLIDGKPAPRIAGVSSFGAGGSNAHLLVEEYWEKNKTLTPHDMRRPALMVLSAKSEERLIEVARNLSVYLEQSNESSPELLWNLAYTLQVGREAMEERLGLVVSSLDELKAKLNQFIEGRGDVTGLVRGRVDDGQRMDPHERMDDGNDSELLERWVRGGEMDWQRRYGNVKPRRISLPTYPFVRKRFWVESVREIPAPELHVRPLALKNEGMRTWNGVPLEKPSGVVLAPLLGVSSAPSMVDLPPELPTRSAPPEPVESRIRDIERKVEPVTRTQPSVAPQALQDELRSSLAQVLFLEDNELGLDKPFLEMGLDSIVGVEWVNAINKKYGLTIPASLVYEHPSLRKFTDFLHQQLQPSEALFQATEPPSPVDAVRVESEPPAAVLGAAPPEHTTHRVSETKGTDIAIIGMAGQFPGGQTLDEFWHLLKSGETAFTDFPQDRDWNLTEAQLESLESQKGAVSKGAFLKEVDRFDPLFFQISPKEAMTMDPGERLFLQESWKAIEDAGIVHADISGRRWGVFCGNGGDYSLRIRDAVGYSPHVTLAQVPSRVSHCLNLTGPSQSVDAGCASALLAIAQACDHLVMGKCEAAIAGGVLVHSTPNLIVSASQVELLARNETGGSALDRSASGMVPSEAAGVLVLKPLADALVAGDRIYGVIEGWGNNHNGKTNGMVSPSIDSQEALFSEVYDRFEIAPDEISFVEANAAGLPLADSAEVLALTRAFRKKSTRRGFCALGSVENNVGHAFHASGMSHVMKVLLSLRHRQIPATLQYQSSDPALELGNSPFFINTETIPWEVENSKRRRAAISSFGATGANVHLVIAEAPSVEAEKFSFDLSTSGSVLIPLSSKTTSGLQQRCRDLASYLENRPAEGNVSLRQLSANLLLRRSYFEHRCALVVDDIATLKGRLLDIAEGKHAVDGFIGSVDETRHLGPSLAILAESKIDALFKGRGGDREELFILADLFVQGVKLEMAACFSSSEKRPLSLPSYAFEKRRCWIDAPSRQSESHLGNGDKISSTLEILKGFLAEITGLSPGEIDPRLTLSAYGVDSLLGMRLLNRVNARFGGGVTASLLTMETIGGVAEEIASKGSVQAGDSGKDCPSNGPWVRPSFIESLTMNSVAADASLTEGLTGEEQLERLIAYGVGVWREAGALSFEFLEKTQTRESLASLVIAPRALYAVLEEGKRYFPVSDMQRFALHESEINRRSTLNLCQGFWVDMPANQEALNAAFNELVGRHSIFRTGARLLGEQWTQVVHDHLEVKCREIEWPHITSKEHFEAELARFQKERNRELFDIGRAPLLDVYYIHNGSTLGAVFFCTHHFHADGFTLYLFQQELHQRYLASVLKEPYKLPEARAEYVHLALSQFAPERATVTQRWLDKLRGKRGIFALKDETQYLEDSDEKAGVIELPVSPEMLASLQEFNRRNQTTLTQLVSCALASLLYRLTQVSLPIQMVYNLRDRYEFESLLGDFSSSLPMLLEIGEQFTLQDVLQSYETAMLDLQRHKHFDFSQLLGEGDVALDSNDRDAFGEVTNFAERLIDMSMEDRQPVASLLVCVVKTHGKMTLPVMYARSRFSKHSIELFVENLVLVLEQMLREVRTPVSELEISSELVKRLAGGSFYSLNESADISAMDERKQIPNL